MSASAFGALESRRRGPGDCRCLAAWLALGIGIGIGVGALPAAAAANEPDADCLTREPVVLYLHRVQDRILDAWELPPDGVADRRVVLQLRIDADGMLLGYELVSFSDRRLAQSVKYAVMLASPFPPIPSEAACVTGRPIVTTFSNPP